MEKGTTHGLFNGRNAKEDQGSEFLLVVDRIGLAEGGCMFKF